MNFKNIYIFAFTKPFTTTQAELTNALSEHIFTPCASTELSHYGWTNALIKDGDLTHESSGNILICARKEEKILPAQVVKEMVEAWVEDFEMVNARCSTKKEREQIKEGVIFELLPRAFSRITDTHAYINAKENIIVINSASRGKAEDLLALLRKSLGTLPVTNVIPDFDVSERMTNWVIDADRMSGILSKSFIPLDEAHFTAVGDNDAVSMVKNHELDSKEVMSIIDGGQYVTKLAIGYEDAISFMLHDDLSIKRIKFSDVILEQNDDIDSDDKVALADADFTLMTGGLNRMINALHAEFSVKATDYLEG